jgi:hypothetical protein
MTLEGVRRAQFGNAWRQNVHRPQEPGSRSRVYDGRRQLKDEEIWNVVNYVRSIAKKK